MTSSEKSWDVIVVGGGHNGLVAAAVLGKAERKVLLVEADTELGGPARTEEFFPGYRASTAHLLNRLHPEVIKELDLAGQGLAFARPSLAPTALISPDRDPILLSGGWGETIGGDVSVSERQAWLAMRAQLVRYAAILKPFLTKLPPSLHGMPLTEALGYGGAALALKRLGKEDMRDFLRMMLMNVHDVADEHLSDDRLKGFVGFEAVLGSHLGPRSPTSMLGLYYRLTGETAGEAGGQVMPRGGMGAVVAAMRKAAEAAGVTIRCGAPVSRILVEKGRVVGIRLEGGEEIRAGAVVSAINPRTTLVDLVGPAELDTGVVRKAQAIRMKGNVAKLHLALSGIPAFRAPREALAGRLVIAPSSQSVERAFNPAKYGELSPEPVMEIVLPSLSDPSLAPSGGCVLSANVQFAPYALKGGWEAGRPAFLAAIMAVLERHAPGIGGLVEHAELLTPADIEARYRMPGGHWHHGELQVDQMLVNRPFYGAERYAAPVDGLWLASAGSHPGGGISGVPGLNAARALLKGRG
ncbi:NAD(P)/FAD-dependent oxidoreductase [Mesorhizobium sp. J428]|uniref:phytoene desaturase family protein n=1 Tax=Mesorhizobium sp. J428 TaxID=2898440 RepID=UPI002151CF2E|nr:NAD(P)/FAD-dependent oxidoreductase [Mesorhizobium sp. J428]MCR5856513.1 NAD(P)/FAD-dependent oxidoreductase [Mesorhizobium sp. J428]